jgi:hypothetical protein
MANYTSVDNLPWKNIRSQVNSIVINEGVTSVGNYSFYGCNNLESVTFPAGLTGIGSSAFNLCNGLMSVTLPATLTDIGDLAFARCNFIEIVNLRETPQEIEEDNQFYMVRLENVELVVPNAAAVEDYKVAESWKDFYAIVATGGETSINEAKKSNGKRGIVFTSGNVVSNEAAFKVVLPNGEKASEVKVVIYDMTGNVVYNYELRITHYELMRWNLSNNGGRKVANGSYLVIADVKTERGATHAYSAKLGVRR